MILCWTVSKVDNFLEAAFNIRISAVIVRAGKIHENHRARSVDQIRAKLLRRAHSQTYIQPWGTWYLVRIITTVMSALLARLKILRPTTSQIYARSADTGTWCTWYTYSLMKEGADIDHEVETVCQLKSAKQCKQRKNNSSYLYTMKNSLKHGTDRPSRR